MHCGGHGGRGWEYLGHNSSLLLGPHELQCDRVTVTLCQLDMGHIFQDGTGRRLWHAYTWGRDTTPLLPHGYVSPRYQ